MAVSAPSCTWQDVRARARVCVWAGLGGLSLPQLWPTNASLSPLKTLPFIALGPISMSRIPHLATA